METKGVEQRMSYLFDLYRWNYSHSFHSPECMGSLKYSHMKKDLQWAYNRSTIFAEILVRRLSKKWSPPKQCKSFTLFVSPWSRKQGQQWNQWVLSSVYQWDNNRSHLRNRLFNLPFGRGWTRTRVANHKSLSKVFYGPSFWIGFAMIPN